MRLGETRCALSIYDFSKQYSSCIVYGNFQSEVYCFTFIYDQDDPCYSIQTAPVLGYLPFLALGSLFRLVQGLSIIPKLRIAISGFPLNCQYTEEKEGEREREEKCLSQKQLGEMAGEVAGGGRR